MEINEKKKIIYNEKRKIFWVQNLKWATAHLSRRLGAGQAQGARGACVGSAGARWAGALGARKQARQVCVGAGRGAQAGLRGRAGRRQQRASAAGVRGSWAQAQAGGRALGARQGAGRTRPRRLGWPWAVHSVHSAHFRSVLTRFFPESQNEHRSL